MPFPDRHNLNLLTRRTMAVLMLAIYLAMTLVPVSAQAFLTDVRKGNVARECVGDCNLCGCSPENRAAKTCCCSKKQMQQAAVPIHDDSDEPDCCKKAPPPTTVVITSCACPCGSDKPSTLGFGPSTEIIPYFFSSYVSPPHAPHDFQEYSRPLSTRHIEPSVPPPRISC